MTRAPVCSGVYLRAQELSDTLLYLWQTFMKSLTHTHTQAHAHTHTHTHIHAHTHTYTGDSVSECMCVD